ncbi:glycosyltransferase family 4 protein [Nitrosarchaeum koreense]|nr:glycosyltransferase family 4 protein [Nitrosarchaeum koreense]
MSKNFTVILKILVVSGSLGKYFHLKEFTNALSSLGVESKLIKESDYAGGFPSKKIGKWFSDNGFKKLMSDFKPDAVFVDRQGEFGVKTIDSKIPLFVLLRGHYWSEVEWAKKTLYTGLVSRVVVSLRNKMAEKCFSKATAVIPICKYIENVVKEKYPNQNTEIFFEGINSSRWFSVEPMKLKHPCVGLLQNAHWWGKAKEMLTLKKVLEELPEVNFYWVGEEKGAYTQKILSKLNNYKNFHWLGQLEYPDKVREFFSGIDIYALITGMDTAPLTLKEAQLMEKPVIATDVGGVSEIMIDKKTGFLVKEGDSNEIIKKIKFFLENEEEAKEMGRKGRKFIIDNFSWEKIAKNFLKVVKKYV